MQVEAETAGRIASYKRMALGAMVVCSVFDLVLWLFTELPIAQNLTIQKYFGMTVLLCVAAGLSTWIRSKFLSQMTLPLAKTLLWWVPEIMQLMVFLYWLPFAITVGDYLVVPYSGPFLDAWLAAPEKAIGLPHSVTYSWFAEHDLIDVCARIYDGLDPQVKLVAAYLLLVRRDLLRLWQYTACLAMAGVASIPVLWAAPALGPTVFFAGQYEHIPKEPPWVTVLPELQAGQLNDLEGVTGLLACPSFHTVFALYLARTWADAPRPVFALAIVFNLLVVVTTIPSGSHYLIDIVGGVVWALVFAIVADSIARRSVAQ